MGNTDKHPKQEITEVKIDTEKYIADSSKDGVMSDKLELGKILGWGGAVLALIILFFIFLPKVFRVSEARKMEEVAKESTFYMIQDLRTKETKQLNSYGLIDKENQVYHMPIDSAISILAND